MRISSCIVGAMIRVRDIIIHNIINNNMYTYRLRLGTYTLYGAYLGIIIIIMCTRGQQ